MNPHSGRRPIPLKQRFQYARIHEVEAAALELKLENDHWAKWARVKQDRLPPGKILDDFCSGDRCRVFLLSPADGDDYYQASLHWGEASENPWVTPGQAPIKGQLLESEAVRYLPDGSSVFVRLEPSGIEALLRTHELPNPVDDIRDAVDIGDRLVVEVIEVRPHLLECPVSIRRALATSDTRESNRRTHEFGLGTVRTVARADWGLPLRNDVWVAVMGPDVYFAEHLARWLEAFGWAARTYKDNAAIVRILQAGNPPTHLILPKDLEHAERQTLEKALKKAPKGNRIQVLWLAPKPDSIPSTNPDNESDLPTKRVLHLPIDLTELNRALEDPDYRPQSNTVAKTQRHLEYQGQQVQRLANDLLERLCARFGFQAALWVVQERSGVFTPRAWRGLAEDRLQALSPRLAQTLISVCIERQESILWPVSKTGPLRQLAPERSEWVFCTPIRSQPLQEGEPMVDRAVAFFYRNNDLSASISEPRNEAALDSALAPYQEAMEMVVHTLHFARHNEALSAFADLGRHSASFLHELGQKALPVQAFLNRQRDAARVDPTAWSNLRRQLTELVDMANGDLGRIRRRHGDWLNLRERLTRLAELNNFRFGERNCAFAVEIPDLPLALAFNPLLLDQTLGNLLDNALYFAGQRSGHGRVTVRVRLDPDTDPARPLVIEMEDNGSGVRASLANHLFEPRHSDKRAGTGMGLFIARSYIRGLGGELSFARSKSARWRRTRFEIRLPVILDSGPQR